MNQRAVAATAIATPVIILAGCMISLLTFGPRSALGFFQLPIINENQWGRGVFSLAVALQNLFWGIGQPFAGAVADRYGTFRVLAVGAVLYAAGLVIMAVSANSGVFTITSGLLVGFGLSGCSFNVVLAAFGKLLPPEKRSMAYGFGTAAGSMGQVIFAPLGVGLIATVNWHITLYVFAALVLFVVPRRHKA
jgi:MFS family permease